MITFICYILVLAGCANWLIIGLMQYDFVAGIFGTQSSLLSRLVYIAIGFAAIWILVMSFVQKGKIKINDNGFKRLNKAMPAPNSKDKNNEQEYDSQKQNEYKQQHDSEQNRAGQNPEYNQHKFNNPPPRPDFEHQASRSNYNNSNIEASGEFYQTNSQTRKNPFD